MRVLLDLAGLAQILQRRLAGVIASVGAAELRERLYWHLG